MSKKDVILDRCPGMVHRVGNHYEGRIGDKSMSVFVSECPAGRIETSFEGGTNMKVSLDCGERVFSTNFPNNLLESNEKCFVPLADFNKLKQAYLELLKQTQ